MRERDAGRGGEPHEVGRLEVPVQRLLQPEDIQRLDRARESDAVVEIVGAFMSSISETLLPMASRTARTRLASSATVPPPVFNLTARKPAATKRASSSA